MTDPSSPKVALSYRLLLILHCAMTVGQVRESPHVAAWLTAEHATRLN